MLRIRSEGEKTKLTFKEKISNEGVKIAEEIETSVSDLKKAESILNKLGLKEIKSTKKHRISYELNGARIELDKYDKIPIFLEIEAKNIEKIEEIAKLLGYSKADFKTFTGKELFDYYNLRP